MDVLDTLPVRFHFGGEFSNDGKNCDILETVKPCLTSIEIRFLYQSWWVIYVTTVKLKKEVCCIGCFLEKN
jgi:hypothetical protein